MNRATPKLLALSAVLLLGACVREPFVPPQYMSPMPPPLQPYMGPPGPMVAAPAPAPRRVVHRRSYRKHYRRVRCRCTP